MEKLDGVILKPWKEAKAERKKQKKDKIKPDIAIINKQKSGKKEIKALLHIIAELVLDADSIEEFYDALREMANAKGITLKPFIEENAMINV